MSTHSVTFRLVFAVALLSACTAGKVSVGTDSAADDTGPGGDDSATPAHGLDERPVNSTCKAPARPATEASVALERVFPSLSFKSPTGAVQPPGDGSRWYVLEKGGKLKTFLTTDTSAETALDLSAVVTTSSEGGLLGVAFHPDYPATPYVYVSYTTTGGPADMTSRLSRFEADGYLLDKSSEEVLLEQEQPYTNHDGGNLAFGPDGYLYYGLGDGGSGGDPLGNGQNTDTWLGKMLRIDVDSGSPYGIPADNPFADGADGKPEIFAWGLRNPWRYSFDRETGELWVGDVGQNQWEEVDKVALGGNYGWNTREGKHCYKSDDCDSAGMIDPIVEYAHSGSDRSVTGGYVYRGSAIPDLQGTYIFADFYPGPLYAITYDPVSGDPEIDELISSMSVYPSSFAEDADGEVYIVDYTGGGLYQIVPSTGGTTTDEFPQKLSETGCVDATDPTTPASGLIPYGVVAPLWSDRLAKTRAFALPDDGHITINEDGSWDLPIGSVVMKTFWDGDDPVETRLLVRHDDGEWAGYSYAWEGGDATLLPAGSSRDLGGQTWKYPSRAECLRCHTGARSRLLGLETGQLNGDYTYENGATENQITVLERIGIFDEDPGDPAGLTAYPDPAGTGDVADRAHAYLHANCSQCHLPGGTGLGALDLRYTAEDGDRGVCADPENGDLGVDGAQVVDPGDPDLSVLALRIAALDANRMPSLGTSVVDDDGLALISQWITEMSGCP